MTDKGTRLSRLQQSLDAARRSLDHYRGTPCEQDYVEMVAAYERRVAEESAK